MSSNGRAYPDRASARELLEEAHLRNPGPWKEHSIVAAECAEAIARECGLDGDKAYILGLMHDIGRREGVTGMRHMLDGYRYMLDLGYSDAARICLTHSFSVKGLMYVLGKWDMTEDETRSLKELIEAIAFDDYDLLIQLVDSVAMPEGYADQEIRMDNVKKRYGHYPQAKWDKNIELRRYFEEKAGRPIADIVADYKKAREAERYCPRLSFINRRQQ